MEKKPNDIIGHILLGIVFLLIERTIADNSISKVEFAEPQPVYVAESPSQLDEDRGMIAGSAIFSTPSRLKVVDLNGESKVETSERFVPAFESHPARIERADGSSKPLSPVVGSGHDKLTGV